MRLLTRDIAFLNLSWLARLDSMRGQMSGDLENRHREMPEERRVVLN